MKKLLLLLLIIGLIFAYPPFPRAIGETDMVLQNSEGDALEGQATYSDQHGLEGASVEAIKMDGATWESEKETFISDTTYTTEPKMQCYYSSQGAINEYSYSTAWLECYYPKGIDYPKEGIYYPITAYATGDDGSEAVQVGLKVARELHKTIEEEAYEAWKAEHENLCPFWFIVPIALALFIIYKR